MRRLDSFDRVSKLVSVDCQDSESILLFLEVYAKHIRPYPILIQVFRFTMILN